MATSSIVHATPNPFRGETTLRWSRDFGEGGAAGADVAAALHIFDVTGRHVRELVGRPVGSGAFEALWDGRTSNGTVAAPGLYWTSPVVPGARSTHIVRLGR